MALPSSAGARGITPNVYYRWSKEFLEAGKKRLAGDTAQEATSDGYCQTEDDPPDDP
jgi:hypothetical protein